MLNDLSFQRKKDASQYLTTTTDSNKTIYDFILKQDSKIALLERDITTIREELLEFKLKGNSSGGKIDCSDKQSLSLLQQSSEMIKGCVLEVLCSNDYISPTLLQLKNEVIDAKQDYDKTNNVINDKILQIEHKMLNQEERIASIFIPNSQQTQSQSQPTTNTNNHSNRKTIQQSQSRGRTQSPQSHSYTKCQLQSHLQSQSQSQFQLQTQSKRLETIDQSSPSKRSQSFEENNNQLMILTKSCKAQEKSIVYLKGELDSYTNSINKRLNEIDKDFDRLIDSLRTQFQNINEMIAEIEESKLNNSDIEKTQHKTVNTEVINNLFSTINQLREKTQKTDNIIASLSKNKTDLKQKDSISTTVMTNEVLSLRKEINADFERINTRILTELQNQSDEIRNLYNISKNQQEQLEYLQNPIRTNINPTETHGSEEVMMTLEQEIDKKANIEQLNYAMEAQAKINEALCSANRIARWSWSHGLVDHKGMILWNVQNINTALDHFEWNQKTGAITITTKGIYQITTGVISEVNIGICIMLNDNNITNMNDLTQCNNMISLNQYLPLSEGTKIHIGLILEDMRDIVNISADSFLEIRKIL